MGRKDKISPAIKIRYVKRFIAREISKSEQQGAAVSMSKPLGSGLQNTRQKAPKGSMCRSRTRSTQNSLRGMQLRNIFMEGFP